MVNGTGLHRARARRREPLAAEREVIAFRLRADLGLSFEEIADRIGVTRPGAWKAYRRALDAIRELIDPDEVQEHVQLQLHRLDRAVGVAMSIADDAAASPDVRLRALDRLIRAEERRSRLLGLDRPQRTEVGIHSFEPPEQLSPEQLEAELVAFGMQAAVAVAAGPDAVAAPPVIG